MVLVHHEVADFERRQLGLVPSYRLVDTCAAEFEAYTPYYYSTYDRGDDEVRPSDKRKVMILGGGPNRIGQGIEFDYCCVHAAFALKEDGFETLMVNSNPETVSTDFDTSDHTIYVVLDVPRAPWVQSGDATQLPWATALDQACAWAVGKKTKDDVAEAITLRVNRVPNVTYTPMTMFGAGGGAIPSP